MGFFERPDQIDIMIKKYRAEAIESDEEEFDPELAKLKWVDSWWFNLIVGGLICLNALTIGLETDANRSQNTSGWWYVIEVLFSLAFLVELVCRVQAHGPNYFTDPNERGWNLLDASIVTVSLVDTLILMPLGMSKSLRFVSMLRFVRLMRLARLIRLLRFFRELWLVASGLIQALKTLAWIILVLFIICYIGSIFTTIMVGRNDRDFNVYYKESGKWDHEYYFKTIGRSLISFLQIVTLDNWAELIVRDVVQVQPGMYVFFIAFICLGTFGVLNLMIGVVVERAIRTAATDSREQKRKKDRDRQLVFGQLREIFEAADVDNSGTLSLQEVEEAINKPEIYNKLRMIDFPVDNPKEVFVLLDYDNTGELTIEEFIKGCLRMKGPAMSKDLLVAQVAIDGMAKQYQLFENELASFKKKLKKLDATARAIATQGERVFLDPAQYRARHPSACDESGNSWRSDSPKPWDSSRPHSKDTNGVRAAAASQAALRHLGTTDSPLLGSILEQIDSGPAGLHNPPALPEGYHRQQDNRPFPALEQQGGYAPPALRDRSAPPGQLALPGQIRGPYT
jgi:voltage-gated sodium channel